MSKIYELLLAAAKETARKTGGKEKCCTLMIFADGRAYVDGGGILQAADESELVAKLSERMVNAETEPQKIELRQILADLQGIMCRGCGGKKPSKMSHCGKCYRKLPPEKQKALYKRFGSGYEAAYQDSLNYLQQI